MKMKPMAGLTLATLFLMSMVLMACGDATNTSAPAATTARATTAASATTAAGAATTAAAGTGAQPAGGKIVVASKDFTESVLVAEMYAAILEGNGIPVERKLRLGTTDIVQAALTKGEVSLYPEYTGTALQAVLKLKNDSNDPKVVYDKVAGEYAKQFKVTVLNPSYNNSNGIAVSKAAADKYKLTKLSDLAPVAKELRFVSNPEFIGARSEIDGLKSLQKTYSGFEFKDTKQVEINLRYRSVVDGQADVCVAFTTDGELAGFKDKLVLLADDKNNFPPYQMAPFIREDALAGNPKAKELLNNLSAKLTGENIQALNFKVAGTEKQEAVDVAKAFLKQEGFIK